MTLSKNGTTMPEVLITAKADNCDGYSMFLGISRVLDDIQQAMCYPGSPTAGTWEKENHGIVVRVTLS